MYRLPLCLCTFVLATAALGQNSAPPDRKFSEIIADSLLKSGAPSVSLAVTRHGAIVFARAFGKADLASGRSADANTRYAIGSVSKQFTAAAILLLQEQGRLSL